MTTDPLLEARVVALEKALRLLALDHAALLRKLQFTSSRQKKLGRAIARTHQGAHANG